LNNYLPKFTENYLKKTNITIFCIMYYLKIYFLCFLLLIACDSAKQQNFDKEAMIANITNSTLVRYEEFVNTSAITIKATKKFTEKTSPENLALLTQAWKASMAKWKECEILNFGVAKDKNYMFEINFGEIRPKLIENVLIDTAQIDANYIKSLGSAAKGLPAIAFLIFEKDKELLDVSKNKRIVSYVSFLAKNVNQNALLLKNEWNISSEYTKQFLRNQDNTSLNMLANQLLALAENLATKRIDELLKQAKDTSKVSALEKALNDKSFIVSSLESIQKTFNGADGLGFDDYLDFLNAKFTNRKLSTAINEQIEKAKKAVQMAENEEQIKIAQDELKKLLILIKTDMFSILSISVSFTDADGD
jgi:uncharacterized protein